VNKINDRLMNRRQFTKGAMTAGVAVIGSISSPALGASKPEKLVYVGDNGPWHWSLVEEVGPAFERATGIKVEFTLLPYDAWVTRMRAELSSGSNGIDIVQWGINMAGWISPHLADHQPLLAKSQKSDFEWDDFLPSTKQAATYDGKLSGIPYRVTTGIVHYQKALLNDVGFANAPENYADFLKAAIACTKIGAGSRYGLGTFGRQGVALAQGFLPWLYAMGGRLYDRKTGEILVNNDLGVRALQFYSELFLTHKVVPPEVMNWEFDDIIAGGQNDRYAMAQMFSPYGTLINDPKLSKTAGRWAWSTVPGYESKSQGITWMDGHVLGVPKDGKNNEWAFEFIQLACSREFLLKSMARGNAAPRGSVLRDAGIVEKFGWPGVAATAMETAIPTPSDPYWPSLEAPLRSAIAQAITGQNSAKAALDALAVDWQRVFRRVGQSK
jgi:multiple sugar transport system substrate-binding protein